MASPLEWTLARLPATGWDLTVAHDTPPEGGARSLAELSGPDLVAAALADEPGAFDLIVERHRRAVYQLCYRFVGNHEDASDLCQDVFLRAYRGLRTFKGQSALGTWLYRIGVNVCLNKVSVKTLAHTPIDDQEYVDTRAESPSDQVLRGERAERVRSAIDRLPRKQRAAIVLRVYHDLSHQEIARTLGSSVGAVKANVFHAIQNLKRLLGDEGL